MKLNLGCGTDYREGYCNIDHRENIHCDQLWDLQDPLPFPAASIEQILAYDILEHFPPNVGNALLTQWINLLQPGGTLICRVPDLRRLAEMYLHGEMSTPFYAWHLYGGQDYPSNAHHHGFDPASFCEGIEAKGMITDQIETLGTNLVWTGHKP